MCDFLEYKQEAAEICASFPTTASVVADRIRELSSAPNRPMKPFCSADCLNEHGCVFGAHTLS